MQSRLKLLKNDSAIPLDSGLLVGVKQGVR